MKKILLAISLLLLTTAAAHAQQIDSISITVDGQKITLLKAPLTDLSQDTMVTLVMDGQCILVDYDLGEEYLHNVFLFRSFRFDKPDHSSFVLEGVGDIMVLATGEYQLPYWESRKIQRTIRYEKKKREWVRVSYTPDNSTWQWTRPEKWPPN